MKLKWLAHSSFLVTANDGTRIIFDPYESGGFDGAVGFGPITEQADIVVMSHDHPDHGYTADVPGGFQEVKEAGQSIASGFPFTGLATFHDHHQGANRGPNIIFVTEVDGVTIAHLGDLGHEPDGATYAALMGVDLMLIPVGGHFTIDAAEATAIVNTVKPKVVVPMHFKVPELDFPLAGVEDFLAGKDRVKQAGTTEIELRPDALPGETEIWVMEHAL